MGRQAVGEQRGGRLLDHVLGITMSDVASYYDSIYNIGGFCRVTTNACLNE